MLYGDLKPGQVFDFLDYRGERSGRELLAGSGCHHLDIKTGSIGSASEDFPVIVLGEPGCLTLAHCRECGGTLTDELCNDCI